MSAHEPIANSSAEPGPAISPLERARLVLEIESAALRSAADRLGPEFEAAINLLQTTLAEGRKIVLLGVGKSGHIGEKIAATFSSTGAPAVVLNSLNAVHGDLGVVREGDCVVALSYGGETEELLHILPALRRESVRLIALTGNLTSSLARLADVTINVSVEREACPLNLAPTASTTTMLAMGDALAMALLEQRGFTPEAFARYHPGGRLGLLLLLRVEDIMRPLDRLAVVLGDTPVSSVIRCMNQQRSGSAAVVDADGVLAGIFTHGDFIRAYEVDAAVGGREVRTLMSKNPVTIQPDAFAVDLLRLLEKRPVDEVIVLDKESRPVGLVDSQDLARHKIW